MYFKNVRIENGATWFGKSSAFFFFSSLHCFAKLAWFSHLPEEWKKKQKQQKKKPINSISIKGDHIHISFTMQWILWKKKLIKHRIWISIISNNFYYNLNESSFTAPFIMKEKHELMPGFFFLFLIFKCIYHCKHT